MESIGHTHTHSGRNFHSYGTTVLLDPRLNPSEHKLLTPPPLPPPPPPKSDIQFQGIEASESKNPLGDRLIGQNNDFTRGWTSNIMPWGMLRKRPLKRVGIR